jgi:predicted GNAT family N-acyltransferase
MVDVSVVRPLRHDVLRAGRPPEDAVWPLDDHPAAGHVAVRLAGKVVSVGSVLPSAPPWAPGRADAWRVRGMATAEERRDRGLGAGVLGALLEHVRRSGGHLVWCEARLGAVALYERAGFRAVGERFMAEGAEHIRMWREL